MRAYLGLRSANLGVQGAKLVCHVHIRVFGAVLMACESIEQKIL